MKTLKLRDEEYKLLNYILDAAIGSGEYGDDPDELKLLGSLAKQFNLSYEGLEYD